jgi:hypothetical protein
VVDGLKALDPKRPIREADIGGSPRDVADVPILLQKWAIEGNSQLKQLLETDHW